MKNKKGFTLIELLAVIVILAIIALIAVPIVLNMIAKARKNAAKSSALGYIDSIEYYSGFNQISEDAGITGYSVPLPTMTNGSVTCTKTTSGWNNECSAFFDAVDDKSKGDKPKTATIVISSTGKVLGGTTMKFGKYDVNYDGSTATVGGESSSTSEETGNNKKYTVGELVQYDPVANEKCTSFSVDNIKNGTSTCYKWRVITVGDTKAKENITLQLDHEIVTYAYWGDYNNENVKNSDGPTMALTMLEEKTSGWNNALKLNYTYDTSASPNSYGTLSCTNGVCTIKGNTATSNLKARLITGEEVTAITKTKAPSLSWTLATSSSDYYYFSRSNKIIGTKTNGTGNTDLSWLIENSYATSSSGATDNVYSSDSSDYSDGYFTLSPVANYDTSVWAVNSGGDLGDTHIYHHPDYFYGLRPVITIPKSLLN